MNLRTTFLFHFLGVIDEPAKSPRERETPLLSSISSAASRPLPNTPEEEYSSPYDHFQNYNSSQSGSETYNRNAAILRTEVSESRSRNRRRKSSDSSDESKDAELYGNSVIVNRNTVICTS